MDIYSLEFWQQVRGERKNASYYNKDFLCLSSETFHSAWITGDNIERFRELAQEFLKKSRKKKEVIIGTYNVLFEKEDGFNGRMIIRTNFIDWCIEKFSNKNN